MIPAAIASRYVADRPAAAVSAKALASGCPECIGPRLRLFILIVGVVSLLFVPVFKSLTGLPPYMGMICLLYTSPWRHSPLAAAHLPVRSNARAGLSR